MAEQCSIEAGSHSSFFWMVDILFRVWNVICAVLAFALVSCVWGNFLLYYIIAFLTHGKSSFLTVVGVLGLFFVGHWMLWFFERHRESVILMFINTCDVYRVKCQNMEDGMFSYLSSLEYWDGL